MGGFFSNLFSKFFTKNLEVCLVGLENSGKTTFCNAIHLGPDSKAQHPPTIGLNITTMQKGGVKFKMWDMGGQKEFRKEWPRYTKDADIIAFVVDVADPFRMPIARKELHCLLEDRQLKGTPILILANKIDLNPDIREADLIKDLNLDYVTENSWIVLPISSKYGNNIDQAIQTLSNYAH